MVGVIIYLVIGLILACSIYSEEFIDATMDNEDYKIFFIIWGLYPLVFIIGLILRLKEKW